MREEHSAAANDQRMRNLPLRMSNFSETYFMGEKVQHIGPFYQAVAEGIL